VLGDDKPKYLNSPETPLFHKGRELYGLYEARKALRRIDRLLIVEGYMDVIALAQFGIRYAVATLGTATTADHLERLFRVCNELVFCFDGDNAGRDAAWKALKVALPAAREGREIRFLFLPDGEDPDTMIRKTGFEDFERRIGNAQPLSEFFFDHLCAEVDMASQEGRARLTDQAKPLLAQLPPGVFRELMNNRLSELTNLGQDKLGLTNPSVKNRPSSGRQPHKMTLVRKAVAILLQNPALADAAGLVKSDWRRLQAPGIPLLGQLLDLALSQPNLTTAALIERWRDNEYFDHLKKLANYDLTGGNDDPGQELAGALERLSQQARDQESENLYAGKRLGDMSDEEKERLRKHLTRSSKDNTTIER
jgi:DNA primase